MEPFDYNGGIFLAAPIEKSHGVQTTFGIIRMRLHKQTRSITIKNSSDIKHFQNSKRDSICKQMGFTRAVAASVYTVKALQHTYTFKSGD